MSGNTAAEIKTLGLVLRRTNYGEADRILNLITPEGKISAMAKGVRKARSKLAGGVEMFTLSVYNIHAGRGELGVVTSAKMVRHFGEIVKDLSKMELAAEILKKVGAAAEGAEGAGATEFFEMTKECLEGLDAGYDAGLVEAWFFLNLYKAVGEEVNLYRDAAGEKLRAEEKYAWDAYEKGFFASVSGEFGADEIKTMRIMTVSPLTVAARIKNIETILPKILRLLGTIGR